MQELRNALRGELVLPGDAAYDEARSVWNGMIDRRPALIVRCAGASDVIAAIGFARSEGLTVAVRGGGHNVAGMRPATAGLVIDLSPMKGVRVDPEARTVRAQAGLTWGELDRETQALGLATTGGLVTSTGIAGFTLGGGIGWLMRKHGLACDNLISADLVTADGQSVHAQRDRPRGASVGVARRRRQLRGRHRVRVPTAPGLAGIWRARGMAGSGRRRRAALLARLGSRHARRALHDGGVLVCAPEPFVPSEVVGAPIFAIACCHLDPEGSAEADLRPLRDLAPAVDVLGPMPYPAIQGMFDGGVPRGSRNYWRSEYVDRLTDEAIEAILAQSDGIPAPLGQLHIHQMGGAMSRVPAGATAFGNRDAGFLMNYIGLWLDSAEDRTNTAWVRAASEAMEPHGTGARYVNFLADEGEAGVRSAYHRDTYTRLQNLKAQFDPTNFFHLNQNIMPA